MQQDGNDLGLLAYDTVTTVSEMAPNILVSAVFSPVAGVVSQGVSATGNAYKQALSEGYSREQAETYAILVGTSEAALQYALGGISKLGGVSTGQLLTKVAGIDNALWRVAATAGVKIGNEVTEEGLQLFLEPLYRTLVMGEDYSVPAMEEILYTVLLTAITTGMLEGGDIASYSSKDINALLEQAKEQIKEDGEKTLQSGNMPDDAHLEIMELNEPSARGKMVIYQMVNMEDAAENYSTEHQNPVGVDQQSGNASTPGVYTDKIKWGIHDIDVRPDGKGFWGKRLKQSDSRVDSYEMKINPQNESYYLPHPEGGYVQFENMVNSTVQDGKLVVQQKSFYHVNDMPEFAKKKVLEEALRQIAAARAAEYKVEWLVSDKVAVIQLKDFFKEQNVDIVVTYYPE